MSSFTREVSIFCSEKMGREREGREEGGKGKGSEGQREGKRGRGRKGERCSIFYFDLCTLISLLPSASGIV